MKKARVVLFDFDLTLADSTLGAVECVNYALDAMALPRAAPEAIRATIGFSLADTLANLTGLTEPARARDFAAQKMFHESLCGEEGPLEIRVEDEIVIVLGHVPK